jgi:hypothetical protein
MTDDAQPTDDHVTSKPTAPGPRPSRLNQALAWVGIAAGGLFVVAAIFFSGFFLSWSEHTGMGHMSMGHGSPMDCCSHMSGQQMMKPDEHMKPGAMMGPGEQMTPGQIMPGMIGRAAQSLQPPTMSPNTPRS